MIPAPLPTVTLRYPSPWGVTDPDAAPCRWFDPRDPSIDPGTEGSEVDVTASVDAVDYARAAQPGASVDETLRIITTVDGLQAVRLQGTTTGEGLGPAGGRRTTWIIDLDSGTDTTGGVLVVSATERATDDYGRAVSVVDDIARSAVIGDDTQGAGTTVARLEGGGRPFAVSYRDGCLTLFAGAGQGPALDEACDLASGALSAVVLSNGDLRPAAGVTSSTVDVVRLRSNTDAQRAAATVPFENADGHGFALPCRAPRSPLSPRHSTANRSRDSVSCDDDPRTHGPTDPRRGCRRRTRS